MNSYSCEDKKFEISLGDNEVNIEIFNFYVRTCLESFSQENNPRKLCLHHKLLTRKRLQNKSPLQNQAKFLANQFHLALPKLLPQSLQ